MPRTTAAEPSSILLPMSVPPPSGPRRGPLASLLLSCHPLPTLAMTTGLTTAAALSGRPRRDCALVAVTVVAGQLTIGWLNDVVDADRDRRTGRTDKPVALGWVEPRTVLAATAAVALLDVPLSLAHGRASGTAHLTMVGSAWAYNLYLKRTVLSWLPYVVSFAALPAFISWGGARPPAGPPTWQMTASVAALGVGVHVLNTLPDLDEDEATGVRHLPLLVARRTGVRRLRAAGLALTVLAGAAVATSARRVGVRR